jgi:methylmalonyl-CoA/ethylmalonyl-CoA epimerase
MTLRNAKLSQVSVNARDLQRACAFYRDTLGLRHLFDAPPSMSFFDCGGIRLMLARAEKPEFDHASSILYLEVDDLEGAHRDLRAKGVRFRDEPRIVARMPDHKLWMTFFEDSEGNVLAMTARKGRR